MNGLKTLTLMQLKDKIDFSYLKSTKQTIFKIVFSLLKFGIVTAILYIGLYLLSYLRLTSLGVGIPTNFFSIIFGFMIVLSVIVATFGLTKSLYLAKDNQVLLTMPTSRLMVFISKVVVYLIYELKRNLTYILPLLVAFGLVNSMSIAFYVWLIVAIPLITLLTVSIGALFSIPALFLTFAIRKIKFIEYAIITVSVGLIIFVVVSLIGLIPENIDLVGSWGTIFWDIQNFLEQFTQTFAPLYYLTIAFVGLRYGIANTFFGDSQIISLLVILGIIVGVLVLTFLLVRPLFFKMASKPFEYTKKSEIKKNVNKQNSQFFGSLKKELLITYRTSEKFNNILLIAVILPIAILLLNKIFGAMDTRLSGTYMTMMFNILLILLITLSSNGMVSKIFSEEGLSAYLNKTMPASYAKILTSKLIVYLVCINLSILASTIIFASFTSFSILTTIIIFLCLSCLYTGHMFWSASLDVMNPQIEQYATTGTHTNNPNEIKSTLFAFIISAVIAFLFYFLISENVNVVWFKILLISVAYFSWNIFMYLSKIKVYYKEK